MARVQSLIIFLKSKCVYKFLVPLLGAGYLFAEIAKDKIAVQPFDGFLLADIKLILSLVGPSYEPDIN